ncbi:hypothetical protein M422DRAFT_54434 [Sphaerobolus stellatus SS14]|uniref:Uncharacterized protein n=1 Tax=Sphaerobolus stellatus (strain SS14) TaxID=990650 RepID=A0A0C9U3Y4_SPHS4|nr:hypothetical protein M422DRAFT_54434 [Sphaerobolus stellatus SS14]
MSRPSTPSAETLSPLEHSMTIVTPPTAFVVALILPTVTMDGRIAQGVHNSTYRVPPIITAARIQGLPQGPLVQYMDSVLLNALRGVDVMYCLGLFGVRGNCCTVMMFNSVTIFILAFICISISNRMLSH